VFHGAPGVTVTNGADHAIRGTDYEGRIEVIDLVNNGLIEAAGGPLELANGTTTNNGVMRSTDQMLVLGSASIINNATILAESGGEVRVSGAMTNNGSIETKTGGAVMLNNAGNISGDGLLVYSGGVFEITGTLAIPNLMLNGVSVDAGVLPWNDQARLLGNGQIVGDFANTGEVAPGTSTGLIEIDGDYSQSGALEIELLGAGPGRFDQLDVTGQASLGGSLQVTIAEGGGFFAGDTFDFLTSETRSGEFDTVDLPTLPGGEAIFSLDYHPGGASLTALVNVVPCDSNSDGLVDSLDLLNLNTQFGGPPGTQSADFNADGRVDIEDFAVLRTFYGVASGASPPAKVTMTTPEPSTLVLLSAALWVPLKRKRKPRQV